MDTHPVIHYMELTRVALFFIASIAMAGLALSAKVHQDRIWIVWAANALYYSAMLYLLVWNQFVPHYAYANRDLMTFPLLLVVLATIAEVLRQRSLFDRWRDTNEIGQ